MWLDGREWVLLESGHRTASLSILLLACLPLREISGAMHECDDVYLLGHDFIHQTILEDEQLPDGSSADLGNDSTALGMLGKA